MDSNLDNSPRAWGPADRVGDRSPWKNGLAGPDTFCGGFTSHVSGGAGL